MIIDKLSILSRGLKCATPSKISNILGKQFAISIEQKYEQLNLKKNDIKSLVREVEEYNQKFISKVANEGKIDFELFVSPEQLKERVYHRSINNSLDCLLHHKIYNNVERSSLWGGKFLSELDLARGLYAEMRGLDEFLNAKRIKDRVNLSQCFQEYLKSDAYVNDCNVGTSNSLCHELQMFNYHKQILNNCSSDIIKFDQINTFFCNGLSFNGPELQFINEQYNLNEIQTMKALIKKVDRIIRKFKKFINNYDKADALYFQVYIQMVRFTILKSGLQKSKQQLTINLIKEIIGHEDMYRVHMGIKNDYLDENNEIDVDNFHQNWCTLRNRGILPLTHQFHEIAPILYEKQNNIEFAKDLLIFYAYDAIFDDDILKATVTTNGFGHMKKK